MLFNAAPLLAFLYSVSAFPCLTQFIEKFLGNRTIYLVYYSSSNVVTTHEKTFKLQYPKILLNVDNQLSLFSIKEENVDYLLLLDRAKQLENVLKNFTKRPEYNNHMKHLVVVDEKRDVDIEKVLRLLWKYDIYNAVVALPQSAYTWYPYQQKNKCGKHVKVKAFNTCSVTVNPFSHKSPKSAQGCVLKSIWAVFPILFQSPDQTSKSPGLVELLIGTLEKTTEVSFHLINKSTKVLYGEHLANSKLTHLTNAIVEEDIDIVSALYWPTVHYQIGNAVTAGQATTTKIAKLLPQFAGTYS